MLLSAPLIYPQLQFTGGSLNTLNAAGETLELVGQVILEEGFDGGAKTISAAGGGSIGWRTSTTVTFSDAASNLRIGIQDVSTTFPAQGDGTWDVYADLVGGTDTIAAATWYVTAMETGSKSITHGDLISISFEMTTRGGTDSVDIFTSVGMFGNTAQPATSLNTADSSRGAPCALLIFDDGTRGWIVFSNIVSDYGTVSYNVNTSGSDEYGNFVVVPFKCRVVGIYLNASGISGPSDFEAVLYSDGLGTPTVIDKVLVDTSQAVNFNGLHFVVVLPDQPVVKPSDNLVVSLRPTLTNNMVLSYTDVNNTLDWVHTGINADRCYGVSRLNNTGAFSDAGGTAKTRRFGVSLLIDKVDGQVGRSVQAIGM